MVIFWTITLLFLVGLLLFFIKNKEKIEAADLRAKENRASIKLTKGQTAYQTYGNKKNPVVVMVHGALVPSVSFAGLAEHIANNDFFVITYDHYGRGFSDRIASLPTMDLYQQQLLELIEKLVPNRKIILLGYSLGGAISTVFTAQNRERIQQLILIAPLVKDPTLAVLKLFKLPLLGRWLFRVFVCDQIIKKSSQVFVSNPKHIQLAKRIEQQYQVKGTETMLIKGFKQHQVIDFLDYYYQLKDKELPILLFAGKVDQLIPIATIQEARKAIGKHQYQEFDNDHDLIQLRRSEILATIDRFLNDTQEF